MEEFPEPWGKVGVEQRFTATLFLFAWALLPVGFMVLMTLFDRFASYRLPLGAGALAMLCLAFWSGLVQRRSSLLEHRTQLAIGTLGSATFSLLLLYTLDLDDWWWVLYGFVFGSVFTMYVSLAHLASCDAPTLRLPWTPSSPLPLDKFEHWNVERGQWVNGKMGVKRLSSGTLLTLFGEVEETRTYLCIDALSPAESQPKYDEYGVDFVHLAKLANFVQDEE